MICGQRGQNLFLTASELLVLPELQLLLLKEVQLKREYMRNRERNCKSAEEKGGGKECRSEREQPLLPED